MFNTDCGHLRDLRYNMACLALAVTLNAVSTG